MVLVSFVDLSPWKNSLEHHKIPVRIGWIWIRPWVVVGHSWQLLWQMWRRWGCWGYIKPITSFIAPTKSSGWREVVLSQMICPRLQINSGGNDFGRICNIETNDVLLDFVGAMKEVIGLMYPQHPHRPHISHSNCQLCPTTPHGLIHIHPILTGILWCSREFFPWR